MDKTVGEEVEVAGYRWKVKIPTELQGSDWRWCYASHWSTGPEDAEELMPVPQHQRLLEEAKQDCRNYLRAEVEQLKGELEAAYSALRQVAIVNGAKP